MNDLERRLRVEKYKENKEIEQAVEVIKKSAVDFACAVVFVALHDKYGFGRYRFKKMFDFYEALPENLTPKDLDGWKSELMQYGFNARLNEHIASRLQKPFGKRHNKLILELASKCMDACIVIIFITLMRLYNWRGKRIKDLQRYVNTNALAIGKNEVTIWEFMKCLNLQCGLNFDELDEWEKVRGEVYILLNPVYGKGE